MVKQIQMTDEFYTYDYDPLDIFDAPDYYDVDEQLVLIACLLLLQQRFQLLQSMSPERVLDEIDGIIKSFNIELNDTALNKLESHIYDTFISELDDWSIPRTGYVEMDTSISKVLTQSIKNMTSQLGEELRLKALYHSMGLTDDVFDVKPNFRRASQKIKDSVGDALIKGKEMSHRRILRFVYGSDTLYRWLTMNDNRVCEWCRYQESLPPRPLDEIPYDHNHGRCELDPVDDSYSDEYYLLLAGNLL